MKIIVPMAGRGSRLRPHTLTTPKPLISISGKPIVQRLVEDIAETCNEKIEEIAFIIGDFGIEVENKLKEIATKLDAKGTIYYQNEPLGTAHAILCAKESLSGRCVVAFADTLFKTKFVLDKTKDGIVWVKQIKDPSSFGVVKLNKSSEIEAFIEKPTKFVSDLAIIGVYYFKSAESLKKELQFLIDKDIKDKGEYQLTSALENMQKNGLKFGTGKVDEWLDCGNKNSTVQTNAKILEFQGNNVSGKANIENTKVVAPCFISENAIIKNSIIGPYVSIGSNTSIQNTVITNSMVQNNSNIKNAKLENSMIGNNVVFDGKLLLQEVSLGDYSEVK